MKHDWQSLTLRQADVALIDCEHRTPPASNDGFPYIAIPQIKNGRLDLSDARKITTEHFEDWTRKAMPQPFDVVLSRRCNPGETAFIPPGLKCALGQNLVLLRASGDQIFPPFLRWLARGSEWWGQVERFLNMGAVFESLKCADIPNFEFSVPPIDEQRGIARVLGSLDDKIELNRRMNRTLEELAAALFRSWFVDFDPVVAKAAGRKPAHLRPALAALFPATFQDSPLGPIPHGWRVSRLADLCTTQYGYTTSATDKSIGPKFLRVMDINKRNWIEWGSVPHCVVPPKEKDKYSLQVGDLVVARMADPGKSAIIEEEVDAVFASYLVRLKTRSFRDAYYLYGFLKSELYLDYAESVKTGSVQLNMNANVIVGVDVVLPPENVLSAFLDFVLPLRKQIIHSVRESRTLAALRDTLLPKLLSGELRVKSAEKLVEAKI